MKLNAKTKETFLEYHLYTLDSHMSASVCLKFKFWRGKFDAFEIKACIKKLMAKDNGYEECTS